MISPETFSSQITSYLNNMSLGDPGRYKSSVDGQETLYASCFALMTMHYLGNLNNIPVDQKTEWSEYILGHQDEASGYFVGPEIYEGQLLSSAHSKEHLSMHLTAHVLPALQILGVKPRFPICFTNRFIDIGSLNDWLEKIDWTRAWLEGNNLLFVGQFLTYLSEEYSLKEAKTALDHLLNWLDSKIDRNTGLWGACGVTKIRPAIYGGYHQLILYNYWRRNLEHKEKLIDSVLSIQHIDGGFSDYLGGGTCEDVDCVDILVNMYKLTDYKHKIIETALKKAALNFIRKLTEEGGFYYKRDTEFYHMGMNYTYAAPRHANMFSTWFSVHALLLISEVIDLPLTKNIDYSFNNTCSMGWHNKSYEAKTKYYGKDITSVIISDVIYKTYCNAVAIKNNSRIINICYKTIRGIYAHC